MRLSFGEYRPDVLDLNGSKLTRLAKNGVPRGDGYGPFKSIAALTGSLPATCRGAFVARSTTDGTLRIFAGTATKLYLLDNTFLTWTDVSKSGGTYSDLDSDASWSFCQFGNRVIASQRNDVMQSYVIGSSSAFANLAGSPPQAGNISVFGSFVIACDISGYPQRVHWCAINDPTGWTIGTSLSDAQDIPDGGRVRRVAEVGNQVGLIIAESAIRRITFAAGSATTFQIEKLRSDMGILAPNSLVVAAGACFFTSTKGFVMMTVDGAATFIGEEKVDRTFLGTHETSAPLAIRNLAYDTGSLGLIFGAADPRRNLVYFFYKSKAGVSGQFDRGLVCHWTTGRWGPLEVSGEFMLQAAQPGLTLEGLDAIASGAQSITGAANNGSGLVRLTVGSTSGWTTGDSKTVSGVTGSGGVDTASNGTWLITVIDGTHIDLQGSTFAGTYSSGGVVGGSIDDMTISLDDFSVSSLPRTAVFGTDHALGFFEGATLEAQFWTSEQRNKNKNTYVNLLTPITDAQSVFCSTQTRDNLRDEPSDNDESEMDDDGDCPVLDQGRYVRASARIPAGTVWNYAAGVDVDAQVGGEA